MKSKKEHLLMIALGKGPKAPPPDEHEPDGDEDMDGIPDDEDPADQDEGDDEGQDDEGYSDEDEAKCGSDMLDAIQHNDPQALADAVMALVEKSKS